MFDWNDLRAFLAVAETGSTLAAGRRLRVSQTTVARRVTALEQALGLTLFDRRQAGYVLTPIGEDAWRIRISGPNLGMGDPVTVTLAIGNDSATTQVPITT